MAKEPQLKKNIKYLNVNKAGQALYKCVKLLKDGLSC